MLARKRAGTLHDSVITHFCQAVDCRRHLHLPGPYFGNAVYAIKATLGLAELISALDSPDACHHMGLQAAAHAIREEVNSVTSNKFRDLLGFVDRTEKMLTRPSVHEDLSIGRIMLITYWHFEMHELDFGAAFGRKIEAFGLHSQGLLPGVPVVLPRLRDGSCEFVVNEQESVMKYLEEDTLFWRFVESSSEFREFNGRSSVGTAGV